MQFSKRDFLRRAGLCLLGISGAPALRALAAGSAGANPAERVAKRWGMVVIPGLCPPGCRVCRRACDKVHNLPTLKDPKHEIKWIWTEPFDHAFPGQENEYLQAGLQARQVPVLCNHCSNPPCVRVCPTRATFKRKDGIVMMDYHRCIGCRFCVAACPYGSRSFNWEDPRPFIAEQNLEFPARTKGVVEKCTFCEERLAKGLIPACVEACPAKAMFFGDLEEPGSEVRRLLDSRFSIRRKSELGTGPSVYYLV